MAQTIIAVPRGQNIGKYIQLWFKQYKTIKYTNVEVHRDVKNKTNVATVDWTLN